MAAESKIHPTERLNQNMAGDLFADAVALLDTAGMKTAPDYFTKLLTSSISAMQLADGVVTLKVDLDQAIDTFKKKNPHLSQEKSIEVGNTKKAIEAWIKLSKAGREPYSVRSINSILHNLELYAVVSNSTEKEVPRGSDVERFLLSLAKELNTLTQEDGGSIDYDAAVEKTSRMDSIRRILLPNRNRETTDHIGELIQAFAKAGVPDVMNLREKMARAFLAACPRLSTDADFLSAFIQKINNLEKIRTIKKEESQST